MVKPFLLGVALIFIMALAMACGGAEDQDTSDTSESAAPTAAAVSPTEEAMEEATPEAMEEAAEEEATAEPAAEQEEEKETTAQTTKQEEPEEEDTKEDAMMEADADLKAAADALANGPGAFYVGDLNQLIGPVPAPIEDDIGDFDGVPSDGLEDYLYVFDSDYYRILVDRANYTDPTEVTTTGEDFSFQLACINRALTHCKLAEWWSEEVEKRTNGQLVIEIVGYPELGISGEDVLELTENGTLSFAELPSAYTAGDLPAMDMKYLWGIYKDNETFYKATAAAIPALDKLIEDRTGGGVTVFQMWRVPENEIFFFSKEPITELEDFHGLKVRSFGGALSDMIDGMGSEAQWVAFAEVYTALERGILDAGVTGATPAYGQRWYEVAKYMNGRLYSFNSDTIVINKKVWSTIPEDLQQILLEEGAKNELEALRLASIQNIMGVVRNVDAGLELVEFSPELQKHSFEVAAIQHVIPAWINRLKGDTGPIDLFNQKIGPKVGVRIEADGSVVKIN
jgi:TRAP-type C4-dicarboxylate transport system substrate-binding protein